MNDLNNNILQDDYNSMKVWLEKEIQQPNQSIHNPNWWLRLAQGAAFRATQSIESSRDLSIGWAGIATSIYTHLANHVDPESRNSYECSDMNMRALMIDNFGCVSEDPILDPGIIENWFIERLVVIEDNLLQHIDNWRELSSSDIKRLRDLKNRIVSLEVLYRKGYLRDKSILSKWIEMKNNLP